MLAGVARGCHAAGTVLSGRRSSFFKPMDWYYLSDSHERIAINEAQLAPLALRGILRPATPVWRRGMSDWAACGEVKPEIFSDAVAGDGDQRHSGAVTAAVNGTVTGIARALAGYNVWLRIFGVALLLAAVALSVSTVLTAWYLGRANDAEWKLILEQVQVSGVPKSAVWVLIAFEGISILLTAWGGFLLLCAASRAKQAAAAGSEQVLTAAIRDTGRYFLTAVVMVLVTILFWAAMVVWLGKEVTFPGKEPSAEKSVSV